MVELKQKIKIINDVLEKAIQVYEFFESLGEAKEEADEKIELAISFFSNSKNEEDLTLLAHLEKLKYDLEHDYESDSYDELSNILLVWEHAAWKKGK